MNKYLKYIGFAILTYIVLWVLYIILVSITFYSDKYGYPNLLILLPNN